MIFKKLLRRRQDKRASWTGTSSYTAPKPNLSKVPPAQANKINDIIMPESTFDAKADSYSRVAANIKFVNTINKIYDMSELPSESLMSYYADYYLAQVKNGGHSQFIHNCHQRLATTMIHIENALDAMSVPEHREIFQAFKLWLRQNPGDVSAQTGFEGGRASFLDTLDEKFYAADADTSLFEANSAFLGSLKNLNVVEDGIYEEALQKALELHPEFKLRQTGKQLQTIKSRLSHPILAPACMIGIAQEPPTVIVEATAGGFIEIGGVSEEYMTVRDPFKSYYYVAGEEVSYLYDINTPDRSTFDSNQPMEKMLAKARSETVGQIHNQLPNDVISRTLDCAERLGSYAAIDLLLRKLDGGVAYQALAPMKVSDDEPNKSAVFVMARRPVENLIVTVTPETASIFSVDQVKTLLFIEREEITAHINAHATFL